MIFLTIGTQLPFPRLVRALDDLAPDLDEEIVAQIGPDSADYPHLDPVESLAPADFENHFARARVIVSHAGIGTILSAQRHGKPLVVMPRQHRFGEHRNDHQMATVAALGGRKGIHVCDDAATLGQTLRRPALEPAEDRPGPGLAALTGFLGRWITTDK